MLEVGGSPDGLIGFVYILGDDPGLGGNSHEVGVAVPTGHDMKMQMPGQARAGTSTEIQPHIEAMRIDSFLEGLLCFSQALQKSEHFIISQIVKIGFVSKRGNKQVAIGVRETVHTNQDEFVSPEHQVFRIFRGGADITAKEAIVRVIQSSNVFHPPRRPEIIEHRLDFQ